MIWLLNGKLHTRMDATEMTGFISVLPTIIPDHPVYPEVKETQLLWNATAYRDRAALPVPFPSAPVRLSTVHCIRRRESPCAGDRIETMKLTIRLLRETDGRWIGDVPELPGVTVYGATADEATIKAKALALRVIAEEIEHGEIRPDADVLQFLIAA
jgi:predicted RNase H-like HicB family nuclease